MKSQLALKHGMGWVPDIPDHRDFRLVYPVAEVKPLPPVLDLRGGFGPVTDQDTLGACVGHAVSAQLQWHALRQKGESLRNSPPSELLIYLLARWLENTIPYDSGCYIRDAYKANAQWGVVPRSYWPYKIKKFAAMPPPSVFKRAEKSIISGYRRVHQDELSLKRALVEKGPIVFGFSVFDSFMSDSVGSNGMVPMPEYEEEMHGGHAVVLCGYSDTSKRFIVRNSWGDYWGDAGYCWMPYGYVTSDDLAADFWCVDSV